MIMVILQFGAKGKLVTCLRKNTSITFTWVEANGWLCVGGFPLKLTADVILN